MSLLSIILAQLDETTNRIESKLSFDCLFVRLLFSNEEFPNVYPFS